MIIKKNIDQLNHVLMSPASFVDGDVDVQATGPLFINFIRPLVLVSSIVYMALKFP